MPVNVDLEILDGEYAVTQLAPDDQVPDWVQGPGFVNVSFCSDELSIVTPAARVPKDLKSDGGWTVLKLAGTFAFDLTGIALSVIRPLSENGLPVFLVSTYHRDYLLVRTRGLDRACELLRAAGHRVSGFDA